MRALNCSTAPGWRWAPGTAPPGGISSSKEINRPRVCAVVYQRNRSPLFRFFMLAGSGQAGSCLDHFLVVRVGIHSS